MATQRTATVWITNQTDGTAQIQLSHQNDTNGTQSGSWTAEPLSLIHISGLALADRVDIAVVAEVDEHGADGGVDRPAGHPGGVESGGEQLGERLADPDRGAGADLEDLAVRAEPAGGELDVVEDRVDDLAGGGQVRGCLLYTSRCV